MFNIRFMCFIVSVFAVVNCIQVSADLVNGSFSEDLTGWRGRWVKKPEGSFPRVIIDQDKLKNKEECLLIDSNGTGGRYQLTQKISVEGGKKYRVSFTVFSESKTSKKQRQSTFRIQTFDEYKYFLKYFCETTLKDKKKKWVKYEMEFETPAKAKKAGIEFNFYTPVKLWLDDVKIIEITTGIKHK